MQSIDIAPDERECMRQLFFNGPTWDGDIVSKAGRAGLMRRGYVERENGWTQLSQAGFVVAEGPSSHDIARNLHEKLVAGINGKVEMEYARQLVKLGWTPPPGHPVLAEPGK